MVKVFHAARQDLEIVWNQARLIPHPIFDTQVAAMVCGFGESVSYVNLVKQVTGPDLDKTSRFTDWSRRPLSQQAARLCAGRRHPSARRLSAPQGRSREGRAGELARRGDGGRSSIPRTYETLPEEAWRRLKLRVKNRKGLAVLIELAAWRERAAQAQDVPRNRILRDEALYDIASHAPTETAQLSQLRTLSDGFAKSARAREIVEVGEARVSRAIPRRVPLRARGPAAAGREGGAASICCACC